MKTSTLLLSAVLALAGTASSFGQVITHETVSGWNRVSNVNFQQGKAYGQTMTLPSATSAIRSMTWRFFGSESSPVSTASTVDAYFAEWTPGFLPFFGSPSGSALWSQMDIEIPAFGSGNYDVNLIPNLMTDPLKSYVMILVADSVNSNLQIALADTQDKFTYGVGVQSNSSVTNYTSLTSTPLIAQNGDWVFSTIIIADSILTPIPESGTVAVLFAGFLAVGLGLRRRNHAARRAADLLVAA